MSISERGVKGYLTFLKKRQPRIYAAIQAKLQPAGLAGLGEDIATTASTTAPTKTFADTLKELVNGAAQVYLTKQQLDSQKKLTDMQLQRASMGLSPLDIDMNQYGLAPTARVGLTSDTSKLLMFGAIGLGAILILPTLLGHRKK